MLLQRTWTEKRNPQIIFSSYFKYDMKITAKKWSQTWFLADPFAPLRGSPRIRGSQFEKHWLQNRVLLPSLQCFHHTGSKKAQDLNWKKKEIWQFTSHRRKMDEWTIIRYCIMLYISMRKSILDMFLFNWWLFEPPCCLFACKNLWNVCFSHLLQVNEAKSTISIEIKAVNQKIIVFCA